MINNIDDLYNKQGQSDENIFDDDYGTVYKISGNIFVARKCFKTQPQKFVDSCRSSIVGFSAGSGCRMRKYLRESMANYTQMVTLTYPFSYSIDGKEIKEHLRRFLQEMRRENVRWCNLHSGRPKEFSAFWFLEFQERGAPHFHILCTWAPMRDWVAETWYRIVNSEDVRHLSAGTRVEYLRHGRKGAVSYASKYACKMEQKIVPGNYLNCGRFWGVCGRRGTLSAATFVSEADKTKTDVQHCICRLHSFISRKLFDGSIECFFKDDNTRVMTVHYEQDQKKIRSFVSRLTALTHRLENLFIDAELS